MSTLESLQEILVEKFALDRAQLRPEAELIRLGVDSLDVLELMFTIEDRFELKITDDIPKTLATLNDVVVYIDALIAQRSAMPKSAATNAEQVS